jgi:hypothetical protein
MSEPLPSGLPDTVADEEDLARILRSSGHYSATVVKASAFLPAKDGMTSVIRHGAEPRGALWELAEVVLGPNVKFHGAAICRARAIRDQHLNVIADEPPPRHANIIEWPVNADPELQKAQQKELALAIAAQSVLVRIDPQ